MYQFYFWVVFLIIVILSYIFPRIILKQRGVNLPKISFICLVFIIASVGFCVELFSFDSVVNSFMQVSVDDIREHASRAVEVKLESNKADFSSEGVTWDVETKALYVSKQPEYMSVMGDGVLKDGEIGGTLTIKVYCPKISESNMEDYKTVHELYENYVKPFEYGGSCTISAMGDDYRCYMGADTEIVLVDDSDNTWELSDYSGCCLISKNGASPTIVDNPTYREPTPKNPSSSSSPKKCSNCGGTGYVKYYYGSSDLEAWLSGHDSYTLGKCTSCKGTGRG